MSRRGNVVMAGADEAFKGLLFADPSLPYDGPWLPRGRWRAGFAMHTFVDDYRLEGFWRRPQAGLVAAVAAGLVTAPDYTAHVDDPQPFRAYQGWRSASVGRYWQAHGVTAVPVVSFGTGVEDHVRPGSAWAVRGASDAAWRRRLAAFVERSSCARLLVFGRRPRLEVACDVDYIPLNARPSCMVSAAQTGANDGR